MGQDRFKRGGHDRRNKRDNDYGSSDSSYSAPSFYDDRPRRSFAESASQSEDVVGKVKFYNDEKGFGFVHIEDRGIDAFLHVSALPAGAILTTGTTVHCSVSEDRKKPGKLKVDSVSEVDNSTDEASTGRTSSQRSDRPRSGRRENGPTQTSVGTVEWFNDQKGFGFLLLENGEKAFLHVSVVEKSNFTDVQEGDRFEVDYDIGDKGPRAIALRRA